MEGINKKKIGTTALISLFTGICFLWTGAGYMTWMYKVMACYSSSMADLLTEVIGYTFQVIGIVLACFFLYKKKPELTKNSYRLFLIIPAVVLSLDFILICIASSVSGDISLLVAGYSMNIFHGFVGSVYLIYIARYVDSHLSGICFGVGYAFGSIFTWLISLIKIGPDNFLTSNYILFVYFGLYVISVFLNILLVRRIAKDQNDVLSGSVSSNITSKNIFIICLVFAFVLILLSAIKNVTFYFPTADLTAGNVSIEYTRVFYAIGLILAGIINDHSRKLGGIICLGALFIPFIMLFLQNNSDVSAILWIIGYILFGLFAVYRIVIFTDLSKRYSLVFLAPLGLCFGRIGDIAGAFLGIKTSGKNTALLIITSVLFFLVILLFYFSYEVARKYGREDDPDSALKHTLISKYGLSQRECSVAMLALDNHTNAEISSEMFISENTVKFHMKNILKKTGCSNRTELFALLK